MDNCTSTPIVQVTAPESERQSAAHRSSWAYLQEQLNKEDWQQLCYHDYASEESQQLWDKLLDKPSTAGGTVEMDADPKGTFMPSAPRVQLCGSDLSGVVFTRFVWRSNKFFTLSLLHVPQ